MTKLPIQTAYVKINPEAVRSLPHADINCFEARPEDPSQIKGGLILIQEIFGVNHAIQTVSKHYASLGYWVFAPAYFDHVKRDVELGYEKADMEAGMGLLTQIGFDQCLADTKAAGIEMNKKLAALSGAKRKTAVVGYCLGGSLVWAASAKTDGIFSAGSGYYGGQVLQMMDLKPKFPVILHFGKEDHHIPLDKVAEVAKAHPEVPVYLYDAGHGFANVDKKDFSKEAEALAEKRTLEHFTTHLS